MRGLVRALVILAIPTGFALLLHLNAASAGFLLLVGVLLIASRESLFVSGASALLATMSYNYFFFPPKRTFAIEDPENWIALVTFLVTSLLAHRLFVREREQFARAYTAREETEALYDLSFALLKDVQGMPQIGAAAARYLERIGAASGALILFGASAQHQQVLVSTGAPLSDEVEDIAAGVARHGRLTDIPSRFGRDVCVPLIVGGRTRAALLTRGPIPGTSALESAANLLAFAIEREQFVTDRAHVQALRETNELKTSLLQAVSHDLKSPLTVLSVESEALLRMGQENEAALVHARTIREEVGRLHRRIDNLLTVARFESGMISPRLEPTPPADLFRAARESLWTVTTARALQITVAEDAPDLLVDPSIALEIVINLIENAGHASPAGATIELHAMSSEDAKDRVWVEVRDRGEGLPPEQARRVRVIDPPDVPARGLGIELARTLAMLSGGSVEWFSRPGGGTIARLDVPAAPIFAGETV